MSLRETLNTEPKICMPILPDVHLIQSTPSGAQQPVNSYLLQTPGGAVLIDPAADCTPEKLPAPPVAILITHVQQENVVGCLHFPNIPLYVPLGGEYLCAGEAAYHKLIAPWEPPWEWETRGNFQGHLAGARNERPPPEPLPVAGVLRDGDEIFGLRVLATPGHAKHAVTFLAPANGKEIAFCGDLICGDGMLWNWFDCDWDYGPQSGQHALLESARRLEKVQADILYPAHGPVVADAPAALAKLCERLEGVLPVCVAGTEPAPVNFVEKASAARGWRELSPHLHQWKAGNCAVLLSATGNALLIDDGLCHWKPLSERAAYHRAVMQDLKRALSITKIETVIPTHYHGDHTENIPDLVATEGAEVLALDTVAEPVEYPERFNLAAPLPWYGTAYDVINVDRRVPDGSRVRWHEYELEIFHLGGQTYYHAGITVEVDGRKVLFVGDAIGGTDVGCEPVLCFNDAEPSTRGWAYAVDRMLERAPDLLVCGHAVAVDNPVPMLREKQNRWQRRLQQYDALDARGNRRLFFDPFFNP